MLSDRNANMHVLYVYRFPKQIFFLANLSDQKHPRHSEFPQSVKVVVVVFSCMSSIGSQRRSYEIVFWRFFFMDVAGKDDRNEKSLLAAQWFNTTGDRL